MSAVPESLSEENPEHILEQHQEKSIRWELERTLTQYGYLEQLATDASEAHHLLNQYPIRLALVDINLPDQDGISFTQNVSTQFPKLMTIVMTGQGTMHNTIEAMKAGAFEFVTKPFDILQIEELVRQALKVRHAEKRDSSELKNSSEELLVGQGPKMRELFKSIGRVASTELTVLIQGESGTGKELIAKTIHQHSNRVKGPFVAINCAAIPSELLESELFGHEKGAFTGANKRKLGRFDKAQGGTLFLDEVNTISPSTQIKLLQILQERIFQRGGGEQPIEADVRIITASNSDLSALCEEGSFRKDLYYRLSVFPIQLPSLRERTEDIPQIIDSLIEWFNQHYFKDIQGIDPFVIKALKQYDWPGNVRELENIIERAYILEHTKVLSAENFPQEILVQYGHTAEVLLDAKLPLAEVRRQSLEQVERQYLKELLMMHQGRVNRAAETAGITTRQLHKLLTKYSIRKEAFKPPKVNKNQPSGEAL